MSDIENYFPGFEPPGPKVSAWATYIPDRRPNFKTHTDRGKALHAVNYRYFRGVRGGNIYRLIDGGWVLYASVRAGGEKFIPPK